MLSYRPSVQIYFANGDNFCRQEIVFVFETFQKLLGGWGAEGGLFSTSKINIFSIKAIQMKKLICVN